MKKIVVVCVVAACLGIPIGVFLHGRSTEKAFVGALKDADDGKAVELLGKRPSMAKEVYTRGQTALHWAAKQGCVETVKSLIAIGANVNAVDELDMAPLGLAIFSGWRENGGDVAKGGPSLYPENYRSVIRLLLEGGADPNHKSSRFLQGELPDNLWGVAMSGDDDLAGLLLRYGFVAAEEHAELAERHGHPDLALKIRTAMSSE